MLQFFRSILHSKLGAAIGLGVLAIIALAFVAGDIGNLGGTSGAQGGVLAEAGKVEVTAAALNREANAALQRVRQNEPNTSMAAFVERGGLRIVLDDLVDLAALSAFGQQIGVVAGDRLIDSELSRAGVTKADEIPRDSVAQRLVARQLLAPAEYGGALPAEMAWRYTQLLAERRVGQVVALPSLAFAPQAEPSGAELSAFYKANTGNFIRPERRILRYASFGPEVVKEQPAPSDAEIAARYNTDKARYAAVARRRITQLVVPTEAAGKAVLAEVAGGKSLQAAAAEKGLAAATLEPLSKAELAAQASATVADAVFAAPVGGMAALARSPIGWHVVKVEGSADQAGRTLAQARGEIAATLEAEKRRAALGAFIANVQEQIEAGANLPELAKSLGIVVRQTLPVTADGRLYDKPGETVPPALKPVLETAFTMQEGEPQVAEVEQGTTFVVYDVTQIAPSAPAPLREIMDDVKVAYALDRGAIAAKAQARQIQAALRKGEKLDAVLARLGKTLPPVQQIAMTRPQLTQLQQSGRPVPPPVRLLFAMAARTVKVQEAPDKRGWFIVVLDRIEPGQVERGNPTVRIAQRDLGKVAGREYAEVLRKAITKHVGVKRNPAAIKAFTDELTGAAGAAN